jgi:hypothetical protein
MELAQWMASNVDGNSTIDLDLYLATLEIQTSTWLEAPNPIHERFGRQEERQVHRLLTLQKAESLDASSCGLKTWMDLIWVLSPYCLPLNNMYAATPIVTVHGPMGD